MTEEATLYKTSDLHSLVPNAEETSTVGRPTDRRFHIDERWDAAIDLTLRRVTLGAVLGAVSAIVLFRSPTARASMLSLGIGFGAGTAFEQSQALVSNSYDEYIYIYVFGKEGQYTMHGQSSKCLLFLFSPNKTTSCISPSHKCAVG